MSHLSSSVNNRLSVAVARHRYNGFGGKVEPNESSLDAAKRELKVCFDQLLIRSLG